MRKLSQILTTAAGLASAITLTAAGIATASTTIVPPDEDVTATGSNLVITTATNDTLICGTTSGTGTVPSVPINPKSSSGGIDIDIDNVTLSNCLLNYTTPATVTTNGGWYLNANGDNYDPDTGEGSEGTLLIPNGGAIISAPGCTIEVAQDSEIGPLPYDNSTSSVTANGDGTVWYESSGGPAYCPPATNGTPETATLSGTLNFDADDPNAPDVIVTN